MTAIFPEALLLADVDADSAVAVDRGSRKTIQPHKRKDTRLRPSTDHWFSLLA